MSIAVRILWSVVNAADNLSVTKNTVSTKEIVVFVNALRKIVAKILQITFCLKSTVRSTKTQISAQRAIKSFVQNRRWQDIRLHTMVLAKWSVKSARNNSQRWVTLFATKRWRIHSVFLKSLKKINIQLKILILYT